MVKMQQGRVQVDADWNEQNDIQFHYEKEYLKDLIGKNGTLAENNGFAVTPSGTGFLIGSGHYYVDGILCENESAVEYSKQPDVLQHSKFTAGDYLIYLRVWERHITHLDDPYIREQALGNVDTATRTKIVWQALTLDASDLGSDKCKIWENALGQIEQPTTGTLAARAKPTPQSTDRCSLYETAGYTRLENQLYRVEVHDGGALGSATLKWSRENGTVVSRIIKFESADNRLVVEKRGKDDLLDFKKGNWVEITDDLNELHAIPGTFVRLESVEDTTITYDPATRRPPIAYPNTDPFEALYPLARNPKIRRWESIKDDNPFVDSSADKDPDGYIELEDGVQVKLSNGNYRTGDYWIIPARTREGKVEWPTDDSGNPVAQECAGIEYHYAPLALLHHDGEKFEAKLDLRSFFSSLTELITMHYAGGDGQEALPDNKLPAPLRVSVTLGAKSIRKTPVGNAKVRFTIIKPSSGTLAAAGMTGTSVEAKTNDNGIAECFWTVADGTVDQQVKAELVECDDSKVPPIYFGATLPIWFYYVAGDGVEERADEKVSLSAGVAIGGKPATGNYKVKFSVVGQGGNLSDPEPPLVSGIATTEYKISSNPKRQQVRAELLFDDRPTNLQPLYFGISVLDERGTSAHTGLLQLVIPKQGKVPLEYGPIYHELPTDFPPAVMLGMANSKGNLIDHTEDYAVTAALGAALSRQQRPELTPFFKPVEINSKSFKVHVWPTTFSPSTGPTTGVSGTAGSAALAAGTGTRRTITRGAAAADTASQPPDSIVLRSADLRLTAKDMIKDVTFNFTLDQETLIYLRWWAIPAIDKETKRLFPVEVRFTEGRYDIPGKGGVEVIDPNAYAQPNIDAVRVWITVNRKKTDPVIELKKNPQLEGSFRSDSLTIQPDGKIKHGSGQPKAVDGLEKNVTLLAIYLDKEDREIASAAVHIGPVG
jgi:hypothetical protein